MRPFSFALIAALLVMSSGVTHSQSNHPIVIDKPFSRATPGGAKVGAGYMTITNKAVEPDRLLSASSPVAERIEIHEMTTQGGVMKMRELPGGLPVGASKSISLAPGGNHLMLMGLKAPFKQGDKVPVTLTFERAGKVGVTLDVQGLGASQPGGHGH